MGEPPDTASALSNGGSLPANASRATAVALALLAAAFFAYCHPYIIDDSYIVFRHAENIARGQGFGFNPGMPVEGVTCLLWTLLLVPFAAVGLPLPLVGPLLSGALGVVTVLLVPRLAAGFDGRRGLTWRDCLPALLLLTHPGFAFWSAGALATPAYALMWAAMIGCHLRGARGGWAVWACLAILTRPETPLLLLAFVFDDLRRWRAGVGLRPTLAPWLAVGATQVSLTGFRWLYFGELVPNTYFAKTGASAAINLELGSSYALRFFGSLLPPVRAGLVVEWIALGIVLFVVTRALFDDRRRAAAQLVLLNGVIVLHHGGDWMPLHRLWVPVLALVYLLLHHDLWRALRGVRLSRPLGMAAVTLLCAQNLSSAVLERRDANGFMYPARANASAARATATLLRESARPGDQVALMDIGQIGYESGLEVIDITGLVTPWVAKSPGVFLNRYFSVDALLARAPRFIVLREAYPADGRIAQHPEFRRGYREVEAVPLYQEAPLVIYRRND